MRVLVSGGRDFVDRPWLYRGLELLYATATITEIIEGGARGADTHARDWARWKGIKLTTVPADWNRYGPGAGPVRNGAMAALKPDVVLICPGGTGTANMAKVAKAHRLRVIYLVKMPCGQCAPQPLDQGAVAA